MAEHDTNRPNQATSFGQRLRERRKALGLSQLEVGLRVGCAEATVQKIESNARRPSRQMAHLLAETLSIPPDDRPAFVEFARTGVPPASASGTPRRISNVPGPLTPLLGRETEL